jgi:hypothetical protein
MEEAAMSKVRGIAILACSAAMLLVPAGTAGAVAAVQGNVRCAVGSSTVHLAPPAIDFGRDQTPPPRPWNASRVTFSAPVTACRGTNPADPAPGGITHGTLDLKGRLKHHDCLNFDGMRVRLKLRLFNAGGALVARSNVGTTTDFSVSDVGVYPLVDTFTFAGSVRPGARGFGSSPVSMTATTNGDYLAHVCSGDSLSSFVLGSGVLSIGHPA